MKYVIVTCKLLVLLYLGYLFIFLASSYDPASPSYRPPFVIFVIDTLNLFIHEAGHFFFQIFGKWIYIFAGSLFQCLIPLALFIVMWKQNRANIYYPGFWLGENLVNVSAYIKDAPYRHLKLLAKGLIHDWNWLLSDNLDYAEPLGDLVYWTGLLLCGASIIAGVILSVKSFKNDRDIPTVDSL